MTFIKKLNKNKHFKKFRKHITTEKVYFMRANSYISILMLVGIYYNVARQNGIGILVYGLLACVGLFIIRTIGWLDYAFNFLGAEQGKIANKHPQINKILKRVNEIQKSINNNTTK